MHHACSWRDAADPSVLSLARSCHFCLLPVVACLLGSSNQAGEERGTKVLTAWQHHLPRAAPAAACQAAEIESERERERKRGSRGEKGSRASVGSLKEEARGKRQPRVVEDTKKQKSNE